MKLLIKKISSVIFILLVIISLSPSIASAFQIGGDFRKESGLDKTGVHTGLTTTNISKEGLEWTVSRIITVALSLVGTLFLILMLYSGFVWMMAKGDEKEVEKAKENIKSAMIGLIVVFAAYAITQILIPLVTGPVYIDP